MYLLWSTCVFALLAVLSGLLTDGDGGTKSSTSDSVTTTSSGPTTSTGPLRTYTIQPGDNLFAIGERFNLSVPALIEINKIENADRVPVGTQLLLPPSNGFVPIGATTTMPP
ncbi:MAG: LysM domain [Actinomycetota bacterium]|jgi:LysM repeat protein